MIPARHELKLIHGGKPPVLLGLPCDSCGRRHDAPRECGECFFLAARQRVAAERRKRRNTRQEEIH